MIESPRGRPGRQIVAAGAVGIILPVGLVAWAQVMAELFPDSCGHYTGCLYLFVQAWQVGRWIAIVLAWPLLYLLRVRPAWPVAVLAAALLVAIWLLAEAVALVSPQMFFTLILLSSVIAYPVAARLVGSGRAWPSSA
jgi:hypothetical protein